MKKIANSPFTLTIQVLIIGLCLCVGSLCSNNFKSSPDYKIYLGGYTPTVVKLSYDEQSVAVGFSNGSIYVYSNYGSMKYGMYSHNYSIVDIEEIQGLGWFTLDSSGRGCKWNTSGYLQYTYIFSTPATDISVTWKTYGYGYVAFNFGNLVIEYNASYNYNTPTRYYYAQTYTLITKIQYSPYYDRLYVATNTSYVYFYNCSSGNYTGTSIYVSYNVKDFNTISTGDVVITNGYYVYKFNETGYYSYFSVTSGYPTSIAASYRNYELRFIAAYANSSSTLYVYDSYGSLKQYLSYNYNYFTDIDAGNIYLVAVDNGGYLSIVTYYDGGADVRVDGLAAWAIALISSLVFLVCVVGVVVMIVRRRKRRQALTAINGYNRFNDPVPTQQYFPNNQGFNNQAPVNQGWNANQGAWNNNQPQPYFAPPAGQAATQPVGNPYQANQPSNWS